MKIRFDSHSMESYEQFMRLKSIPKYDWRGRSANVPEEYAYLFDKLAVERDQPRYLPSEFLFDYQRDISKLAIRKRKFSVFAQPGMGKTAILFEVASYALKCIAASQCVLIVSPLMVIDQTIEESIRFYGEDDKTPVFIPAAKLQAWMENPGDARIAITNYESIKEGLRTGSVAAILMDESSTLKNFSAAWANRLIELGKGLQWKFCFTGTPAPNDQIEYANHAVFMDHKKTVNEFLATYFINRGETNNRWELKRHALGRFYRDLSHWCIFLSNPATYGWKDNCGTLPKIHVHIERIDLTPEQQKIAFQLTGDIVVGSIGGIGMRGKLSQLAKGKGGVPTNKPEFIRNLRNQWPDESTIIWCKFNDEQATMERMFPDAASMDGDTPHETRQQMIRDFKSGVQKTLISKAKIIGLGLNLQVATRHIFSGMDDSYETWVQCLKRSNRIGSTEDLHAHIPLTELEEPMMENVLRKADRVHRDEEEQERLFKESGIVF